MCGGTISEKQRNTNGKEMCWLIIQTPTVVFKELITCTAPDIYTCAGSVVSLRFSQSVSTSRSQVKPVEKCTAKNYCCIHFSGDKE